MMSARLSSLLVAGGVVLAGIQPGSLIAAVPTSGSNLGSAVLQGATLEMTNNGADTCLNLDIPSFTGVPKLQVLSHPNRIVVDLPGVKRGVLPNKNDMAGWASSLIQRARLAQFAEVPFPVTRLVLEVAEGTNALVSPSEGSVRITLQQGTGKVQAHLVPADLGTPQVDRTLAFAAPAQYQAANALVVPVPQAEASTVPPSVMVNSSVVQIAPLIPVPSISIQGQAPSPLSLSSLLPVTLAAAQDKTPAKAGLGKDDPKGRTLGEVANRYSGSRITIDVKGAELSTFLRIIADHAKLNLVADQDVQGIYDFKFTDTPWDQVLDIIVKHAGLGKEISNGVIRVAKIEKLQKEEDDRKKLEEAKALAGDLTTITRPLSFAKASETKPIVEKMLTKRGSLLIDDRTNVLIISDLPKNLPLIDDLVQQLDVQIQQVQIEARVVEASGGYEKAFGVKWPSSSSGDFKYTPELPWGSFGQAPSWNSAGGFNRAPSGQHVDTSWRADNGIAAPAGEFWVSFLSNRMSVNVILQALEKDGKIRIVSNPKVVTQNNKKATILSGTKIPYPTQQGGAQGGAITVAFADANLQLDVTPQITNDGTIIMDLKIEKAEADFSAAVQGTPSILRKFIETQVLVKDGGTAVLGGVYTTVTNSQTSGIPFLSKIPILGWLFRTKSNKENNTELLIFITPRILKM